METEKPQESGAELNNQFILVLKDLQLKLQEYEGNKLCAFVESMKGQIEKPEKMQTDNPKFNEFIKKFTDGNMAHADVQYISKKLMMAYLYINTE